jgi:hypothetical protein
MGAAGRVLVVITFTTRVSALFTRRRGRFIGQPVHKTCGVEQRICSASMRAKRMGAYGQQRTGGFRDRTAESCRWFGIGVADAAVRGLPSL